MANVGSFRKSTSVNRIVVAGGGKFGFTVLGGTHINESLVKGRSTSTRYISGTQACRGLVLSAMGDSNFTMRMTHKVGGRVATLGERECDYSHSHSPLSAMGKGSENSLMKHG